MDMDGNVCRFVPKYHVESDLNILNFVYEQEKATEEMSVCPYFSLHFVAKGTGILHTKSGDHPLEAGDLFLRFPSKDYGIESTDSLEYLYISFVGNRAYFLLDRTPFSQNVPVCHGFGSLRRLWLNALLNTASPGLDLAAEGVLLYTLSRLCSDGRKPPSGKAEDSWILQIKNYVDSHYSDPALSLQNVARRHSYSYKYVSSAFHRMVGVSFTQYLNNLRLDCARHLIDSGMNCVKEIALLSGYTDALYFSKLFRQQFGMSPSEYLRKQDD